MSSSDRSFAEVVQDIVRNIQEILRSEIRLAKTEMRQEAVKAKAAGTMLGGGALAGVFSAFFLLLAIVYALTRVMPDWAAALVVAAFLGVVAAATLSAGRKQLKLVHPAPEKTIESVKEDVQWVQQQIK